LTQTAVDQELTWTAARVTAVAITRDRPNGRHCCWVFSHTGASICSRPSAIRIRYDEVDEHVELPLFAPARIPNALHPIALCGSARLDRARGSGRGDTAAPCRPSQISRARRRPVAVVERQPRTAGFQRDLSSISPAVCTRTESPRRPAVSATVVNSQGSLSPCDTGEACDTRSSRPMACRRRAVWGCRAPGRALTPAIRRQPGGTLIFRTGTGTGTDAFA